MRFTEAGEIVFIAVLDLLPSCTNFLFYLNGLRAAWGLVISSTSVAFVIAEATRWLAVACLVVVVLADNAGLVSATRPAFGERGRARARASATSGKASLLGVGPAIPVDRGRGEIPSWEICKSSCKSSAVMNQGKS